MITLGAERKLLENFSAHDISLMLNDCDIHTKNKEEHAINLLMCDIIKEKICQ